MWAHHLKNFSETYIIFSCLTLLKKQETAYNAKYTIQLQEAIARKLPILFVSQFSIETERIQRQGHSVDDRRVENVDLWRGGLVVALECMLPPAPSQNPHHPWLISTGFAAHAEVSETKKCFQQKQSCQSLMSVKTALWLHICCWMGGMIAVHRFHPEKAFANQESMMSKKSSSVVSLVSFLTIGVGSVLFWFCDKKVL